MRLKDNVVIVTGAGTGIGAAVVEHLISVEGASVVAVGRRAEPLEALAEKTGCLPCAGDVSKRADVKRIIKTATSEYGGVDTMISNHGVLSLATFETTDEEVWRESLEINTVGPFLLAQESVPAMESRGGGSIVLVSSVAAYFAYPPDNVAYASSKGAVITMTRTLAVELGSKNIRVNCICPGLVRTPMVNPIFQQIADNRNVSLDEAYALAGRHLPAGRMGLPADFGGPCAFFASEDSRWVTGAILNVDGGTTVLNPGIMSVMREVEAG
jgi:meso-butanediol dehydrogenase/(S,S)-butanediol dehydrogenase/diacetyl reductase